MSLPKHPEKFAQFLKLLNHCYQLSDEKLTEIQTTYQENEYDEFYHLFELLTENFDYYNDDWKFATADLSGYISERIHQEFSIDIDEDSEYGELFSADLEAVIDQLENESEYSLLPIASGDDTIDVWVVQKSDKPKLIELADELGLIAG